MTLGEYADKLGPEFKFEMEKRKNEEFPKALLALGKYFGIQDDINKIADEGEGENIIPIFEAFYSIGFYTGIELGMSVQEDTNVSDTDLLTKYQDEIAAEFNSSPHYSPDDIPNIPKNLHI